jgi:hypothetical protein
MSRESLDEATRKNIQGELPDVLSLQKYILRNLRPDTITAFYHQDIDSMVPIAAVCLADAVHTLTEARYAMFEALAHLILYRAAAEEETAVFFARFYADNVALRLYSSAEHLANAVVCMLEIDEKRLEPYTKKYISRAAQVGNLLKREFPNHAVTNAILALANSPEWQRASLYRNEWVHGQPPNLINQGDTFARRKRWERIEEDGQVKHVLAMEAGGDTPEFDGIVNFSIDDLIAFVKPALSKLAIATEEVTGIYDAIVRDAAQKSGLLYVPSN